MKPKISLKNLVTLLATATIGLARAFTPQDYVVHVEVENRKQLVYGADRDSGVPIGVSSGSSTTVLYYVTDVATGQHCVIRTWVSGRSKRFIIEQMTDAALWHTVYTTTPQWHEHSQRKTLSPRVDFVMRSIGKVEPWAEGRDSWTSYQLGTMSNVFFPRRPDPIFLAVSLKGPGTHWGYTDAHDGKQIRVTNSSTTTTFSRTLTEQALGAPDVSLPGQWLQRGSLAHAVYMVARHLERNGFTRSGF